MRDLENIINKDVPILYSMQISKTDLGMAFAKYFNNTTVPSTYLVNDNLEITFSNKISENPKRLCVAKCKIGFSSNIF